MAKQQTKKNSSPKLRPVIKLPAADVCAVAKDHQCDPGMIEQALIDKVKKCMQAEGGLDIAGVKSIELLQKLMKAREAVSDKVIELQWDTIAIGEAVEDTA